MSVLGDADSAELPGLPLSWLQTVQLCSEVSTAARAQQLVCAALCYLGGMKESTQCNAMACQLTWRQFWAHTKDTPLLLWWNVVALLKSALRSLKCMMFTRPGCWAGHNAQELYFVTPCGYVLAYLPARLPLSTAQIVQGRLALLAEVLWEQLTEEWGGSGSEDQMNPQMVHERKGAGTSRWCLTSLTSRCPKHWSLPLFSLVRMLQRNEEFLRLCLNNREMFHFSDSLDTWLEKWTGYLHLTTKSEAIFFPNGDAP